MKNAIRWGAISFLLAAGPAGAGSQLEDTVSSCSGINCGALVIRGVQQTNEPFVVQVFSAAGECLRLDIDEQSQNLGMATVSPNVFIGGFSDDRSISDDRPLIRMDPTDLTGWHTIVVSLENPGPQLAKFTLKYGRYPTGNPNCEAATSLQSIEPQANKPASAASPAETASDDE